MNSLIELCSVASMEGNYEAAIEYADIMKHIGKVYDEPMLRMYGSLYRGQSNMMLGMERSIVLPDLDTALNIALDLNIPRVITSVYNAYGIYFVDNEMDYHKGLEYFLKALVYAEHDPHRRSYPITLGNLAMTYYMRNDTLGLKYALRAYAEGHRIDDDYSIFTGGMVSGYMYFLKKDYDLAIGYLDEIAVLAAKYKVQSEFNSLYGNILYAKGDDESAEKYYNLAMEGLGTGQTASDIMTCLSYGSYLVDKGQNSKAVDLLRQGIDLSDNSDNAVYRYKLYERMAEALYRLGDKDGSIMYLKKYHAEADSVFNVERERSINELSIKYETEKRQNEINSVRLMLVQQQKKSQVAGFILIVMLLALGTVYLLFRRKEKMYDHIVKRQHELLRQEKMLEPDSVVPVTGIGSDRDNSEFDVSSKYKELYQALHNIIVTEKLYRQNDISVEKLAARLDTNRTYVSRAINQHAGVSFYNYINSYRIEEAIRILSDPDNTMPLKALAVEIGFNNIQTFYRVFQNAIGMPPSKYRAKSIDLYKGTDH